jgi:exodeoxyribonuclease VII large subunit
LIEEREHILQLSNRLENKMNSIIELEISKVASLLSRPVIKEPLTIVNNKAEEIKILQNDTRKALASRLREEKIEIREIKARIAALSPLSTLKRGYAVVQKKGKVILDAKEVALSERLDVVLAKGEIEVEVRANRRSVKSKER